MFWRRWRISRFQLLGTPSQFLVPIHLPEAKIQYKYYCEAIATSTAYGFKLNYEPLSIVPNPLVMQCVNLSEIMCIGSIYVGASTDCRVQKREEGES
ncbi:hypothetical protein VN97_g12136 [Penicillium thymicola]|uniref:Uncharacterized protein n=1 Tax=Penicillium thymicola TaxID=293382 RepID=A0AAI9X2J1_PENTH|nr:hypothetical protein VN97_g12136 [Penicillium thymicola]